MRWLERTRRFLVGLAIWGATATAAIAGPIEGLRYIGQQTLPTGSTYSGTEIGGLSGIDYDPATGTYWAISDERSATGPARFYNTSLDFDQNGFYGVSFNSVQTMKRSPGEGGGTFPLNTVDPEAIRYDASSNTFYWASEGDRLPPGNLQNPFVREMDINGDYVRELATPAKYNPTAGAQGIRRNLAFESLTLSTDGQTVYTATENALFQDGTDATLSTDSPSRILSFNKSTGAAGAEYVYRVSPVIEPPLPSNGFATNGLVELLALDAENFLAVERSFSTGRGNRILIYNVNISGATDVSSLNALTGSETPVSKSLLFDLDVLGIPLDNIEGITLGPKLANGNRSVILVSDNNFSGTQFTQFIVMQAVPEPSSMALCAVAVAALVFYRSRRRTIG